MVIQAFPAVLVVMTSVLAANVQSEDNLSANSAITPLSSNYESEKGNLVQSRNGDVLIGGLIRVHKRGAGDKCSTVLDDGVPALETINMIIDQVNNNASILPGISLGTLMVDTCDIDTHALQRAVKIFLPLIGSNSGSNENRSVLAGVVGAMSSAVSIQTASLLQIFKIPQISPWSTHPDLSNKNRFPYFFRTVPSDAYQAHAMLALVRRMRWNYISIVFEDDFYGVRGSREIERIASTQRVCVAHAQAIPRNPTDEDFKTTIKKLLLAKAKVVVVFTKSHDAEHLIHAAHLHPKGRGHFLWIGSDGWAGQIPTNPEISDYVRTLNGAITFSPKREVIPGLQPHLVNLTLGQFLLANGTESNGRNPWFPEFIARQLSCSIGGTDNRHFKKTCNLDDRLDSGTYVTLSKMQSVADAVLAFVAALHDYQKAICKERYPCKDMLQLSERNKLAEKILPFLRNVSYKGVNGELLQFDSNQDGPAVYDILTYNATRQSWIKSGLYRSGDISWLASNIAAGVESVCSKPCNVGQARKIESSVCCWLCVTCQPDQYVSKNGTECSDCPSGMKSNANRTGCVELYIRQMNFASPYSIGSVVIAVLGIVMTSVVTGIFLKHRDTAIVKASGKELCVFVLGGAFLCFLDAFVLSGPANVFTCSTSRLLLAIGPAMMYAGLLSKTVRVVIIFQSKKILTPQVKTFLQPKFQILTTCAFIFLQAFVITVWFAVSPPRTEIVFESSEQAFETCRDVKDLLTLVGMIYPSILIVVCTVLTTINRNVPTGFNETQYIGFTMYATCVIWLAFLVIFITNSSNVALKVSTVTICLSLSAITVLACLFGFRCYVIIFHPENNTSKSVMSSTNTIAATSQALSSQRKETVLTANNKDPKSNGKGLGRNGKADEKSQISEKSVSSCWDQV